MANRNSQTAQEQSPKNDEIIDQQLADVSLDVDLSPSASGLGDITARKRAELGIEPGIPAKNPYSEAIIDGALSFFSSATLGLFDTETEPAVSGNEKNKGDSAANSFLDIASSALEGLTSWFSDVSTLVARVEKKEPVCYQEVAKTREELHERFHTMRAGVMQELQEIDLDSLTPKERQAVIEKHEALLVELLKMKELIDQFDKIGEAHKRAGCRHAPEVSDAIDREIDRRKEEFEHGLGEDYQSAIEGLGQLITLLKDKSAGNTEFNAFLKDRHEAIAKIENVTERLGQHIDEDAKVHERFLHEELGLDQEKVQRMMDEVAPEIEKAREMFSRMMVAVRDAINQSYESVNIVAKNYSEALRTQWTPTLSTGIWDNELGNMYLYHRILDLEKQMRTDIFDYDDDLGVAVSIYDEITSDKETFVADFISDGFDANSWSATSSNVSMRASFRSRDEEVNGDDFDDDDSKEFTETF